MNNIEERLDTIEHNVATLALRERRLTYRSHIQDQIIEQMYALCHEKGFDARVLQIMDPLIKFDIEMREFDEEVQLSRSVREDPQ